MTDEKTIGDALAEFGKVFRESMDQLTQEQEAYWQSLSEEDQLKAFCAVVRRIYQAEITESTSYRGALYGVFGFGPEAYAQAQCAGYLDLHNAIYDEKTLAQVRDDLTKIQESSTEEHIRELAQSVKTALFL